MTRRIAVVFAHPDDETFCTGGTIAKYASEGVGIDLFCATSGDAGKTSGVPVSSREELARIRQEELRSAASVLGVESIELGDYIDRVTRNFIKHRHEGERFAQWAIRAEEDDLR